MEIVIHCVNQRSVLSRLPRHFGVEIDLRAEGSEIVLNHDPFRGGERFADWLDEFAHGLLVLNIKEAGIESEVIRLAEARGISRFFLLDVEFPYLSRASRAGERRIAVRFSEQEAIGTVLNVRGLVDWVWIDTPTRLPVTPEVTVALAPFRTCLVCPERWGRPGDIPAYRQELRRCGLGLDAVMTTLDHAAAWSNPC